MEKDVIEWVKRISEKRDELGGFNICLYAKAALEEKKVYWTYFGYEPEAYILKYIEATPSDFEVIIFYDIKKTLTDDELISIISRLQEKLPSVVFLKDHPDNPGYINGVCTSNGEYPTILAQPRSKLVEAREKLRGTNYYKYWSDEYKKEIWSYGDES